MKTEQGCVTKERSGSDFLQLESLEIWRFPGCGVSSFGNHDGRSAGFIGEIEPPCGARTSKGSIEPWVSSSTNFRQRSATVTILVVVTGWRFL